MRQPRGALSSALVLTAFVLAGCGGGGGTSTTAGLPPQATSSGVGKTIARVTISIPPKSPSTSDSRKPAYVSPATQSITVKVDAGSAVAQNLTPGSSNCNVPAPLAPLTCTVDIVAAPGAHTLTFTTYDQVNAAGNQLSVNSVVPSLTAGQVNLVNVTLAGIPKTLAVAALPGAAGISGDQVSGITYLFGTPRTISVNALDADGNFILGPGAPVLKVAVSGPSAANLSVTPSANGDPNAFTVNATTAGTATLVATATPASALGGSPFSVNVPLTSTVLVSTIDGNRAGYVDGANTIARFSGGARSIAFDPADGNLYMQESWSCSRVRRVTVTGTVKTIAGAAPVGSATGCGSPLDGTGAAVHFGSGGSGIAYDSADGNLYVSDTGNCELRVVSTSGVVTTLAGNPTCGDKDAQGASAQFGSPAGIAYDPDDGNLYVADTTNCVIRKVSTLGVVTTLAGISTNPLVSNCGFVDGTGSVAQFSDPLDITYDSADHNLYVVDERNCAIRRVTTAGVVTTVAGGPPSGSVFNNVPCSEKDGTGTSAGFNVPGKIVYDALDGNFYILDAIADIGINTPGTANTLRQLTPSGVVTTVAGNATTIGLDGLGTIATFGPPGGLAFDSSNGMLYILDDSHIRQVQL